MLKREFTVDVVLHKSGTLVATSKDISGLVLEVNSFDELREEILTICPVLLVENHGFEEIECRNVLIRANVIKESKYTNPSSKPCLPALIIQEDSRDLSIQ